MATQANTLPQSNSKRFPAWLKVIIGMVVAVLLFGVGAYLIISNATKGAVKISDQLVANIQSGNAEAAYSLTTPSFQEATTPAQNTTS